MSTAASKSKPLKSAFANKRKQGPPGDNGGNGGGGGGGWAAKRVKIRQDREIVAQQSEAALKDGELDLQAFLNAREFEIKALEESMRHTKGEATSRAFQQVPRGMRRRTASHNAKRVPKRLRRRALKEMTEDNTPVVISRRRKPKTTRARIRAETAKRLGLLAEKKRRRQMKAAKAKAQDGEASEVPKVTVATRATRPKIRRNQLNEPPKRKSKFRKRQINKTWLPTHLWHAKRAKMTEPKNPLWRFAIPLTPNEKTYRATHRAQGEKGVVAWDTSYTSTIGLYGSAKSVEQVLRKIGVAQESCWNDRGAMWRAGTRHWTGFLSKETRHDRRDICPATIIWNPEAVSKPSASEGEAQSSKTQRQVFLRVHPSAFLEVFTELLRLVKMHTPRPYIEDLRFEIGSIELTGPASTEALLGILHPYHTKELSMEKHAEMFNGLTSVMSPATLHANATLGFSVLDPRLRYPPKRVSQPGPDDTVAQSKSLDLLAKWPSDDDLKPYGLFHRDSRASATHLPSQKSIDRRKGARRPGTVLEVSEVDPPIPVLLLASRAGTGNQVQGTWTLLAPWRCIQPIWHSLVHFPLSSGGNPRFSGLNEIRQVAFERNLPCFPFDHLGTNAGAEWELEERAKRKRDWERRPKSKRVAWESLDLGAGRKGEVGDGFACDLEYLFKENKPEAQAAPSSDEMDVDEASPEKQAPEYAAKEESLQRLIRIRKEAFRACTTLPNPAPLPPRSILNVNISMLSRGVATACARIYRLPSRPEPAAPASSVEVPATVPPPPKSINGLPADLRSQWLATLPNTTPAKPASQNQRLPRNADLQTRKKLLAQTLVSAPPPDGTQQRPNQTDMNGHPLVPNEDDLIGFVTTGAYSLSEGRATAIGCVSAERAAEALRKGGKREGVLCIVRNAGESVGWIARWDVL